jgi:hypothetical protein
VKGHDHEKKSDAVAELAAPGWIPPSATLGYTVTGTHTLLGDGPAAAHVNSRCRALCAAASTLPLAGGRTWSADQ